jgi:alkylation response protein AidB-like acyl-CoA dehydrogenase
MLRPETAAEAAFRSEVRAWLAANVPDALRHGTFRPLPAEGMPWYRALSQRGWIAPHWPRSHGGMGASPVQQVILMEEMALAGTPDIPTQGLNHIGPLLIARGTPAQQQRHLPPILAGDAIWCQGYSEPGSGSDLASLRTRAEVRGDTLVINGHKIWTTWGHHADWMFALVRTSSAGKRVTRSSPKCSSTTWRCRSRTWSARSTRAGRSRPRFSARSGCASARRRRRCARRSACA